MEAAIFKNLLPVTSGTIRNSILELQHSKNMRVAVGILFLGAIEAELCCEHFVYESGYITNLTVAILNFLLPFTLDSIHNTFLEFLDPKIWW